MHYYHPFVEIKKKLKKLYIIGSCNILNKVWFMNGGEINGL